MINQRGVNLHTMSQSRMSRSTRLKRKNRPKTCAKSSQKDRLPSAEARQSIAEAKVDPMNSNPSGTPSKIDIRLSFSDLGGTISRISLGKCLKNMRGLKRSKTSKYAEVANGQQTTISQNAHRVYQGAIPSTPTVIGVESVAARVYCLHYRA